MGSVGTQDPKSSWGPGWFEGGSVASGWMQTQRDMGKDGGCSEMQL